MKYFSLPLTLFAIDLLFGFQVYSNDFFGYLGLVTVLDFDDPSTFYNGVYPPGFVWLLKCILRLSIDVIFLTKILNYRKNSKAIHDGKTIHFAPNNGIYTLFRILNDEIVVLILNKNESAKVDLSTYKELGFEGKKMKNILTGEEIIWDKELNLSKKGTYLFTTKMN